MVGARSQVHPGGTSVSGHFICKCRVCKEVVSQCRCPAQDKEERWVVCEKCKVKEDGEVEVKTSSLGG